jgi:uncharacterized protein (DUF305 family)
MRLNRGVAFGAVVVTVAVVAASCGTSGGSSSASNSGGTSTATTTSGTNSMDGHSMSGDSMSKDVSGMNASSSVAPDQLIVNGDYSDHRFVEMMTAHHKMAVEMAQQAVKSAQHKQLKAAAQKTITEQGAEIGQLEAIAQRTGDDVSGTSMSATSMNNTGMMSPSELANSTPFDRAYIDSMAPHHAGAIEMASVALMRSSDAEVKSLARQIIDAQAKEIAQLEAWRQAWYGA